MTDRVRSLTVALTRDIRTDDIESLVSAIEHIKGVLSVTTNVIGPNDYTSEERIRWAVREKVLLALDAAFSRENAKP